MSSKTKRTPQSSPLPSSSSTEPTDQSRLASLIQKKKECDKVALDLVLKLIEPGVTKEFLISNSLKIALRHYEDVIEERRISGHCGWALCDNKLDHSTMKKQQYVIRGKRVLDITKRKSFCSAKCYGASTHFQKQLPTSPLWMRSEDESAVYPQVLDETDEELELHGITVNLTGLNLGKDEKNTSESSKSDSSSESEDNAGN